MKKLCMENNVVVKFFPDIFCIKELKQGKMLLVGGIEQGLYKLPKKASIVSHESSISISNFSNVFTQTSVDVLNVHSCASHVKFHKTK